MMHDAPSGSSNGLPSSSSPPPRRAQFTYSTQRAEFTKPVPPGLLPVYCLPRGSVSSDGEDEDSIVDRLTEAMAVPHARIKNNGTAATGGTGELHQEEDDDDDGAAVATNAQNAALAEKSGINPISSLPRNGAGFERSLGKLHDVTKKAERSFVMARIAAFLGLQKRRNKPPSPRPSLATKDSSRSDSDSNLSALFVSLQADSRSTTITEDDCEVHCDAIEDEQQWPLKQGNRPLKYSKDGPHPTVPVDQPKRRFRQSRSRSLDVGMADARVSKTPETLLPLSDRASLTAEFRPRSTYSHSLDGESRGGRAVCVDGDLRLSSCTAGPVSLPPDCVLVRVCAVGLAEADKEMVMGSDGGRVVDGKDELKRAEEIVDQRRKEEYFIFDRSTLLGWSLYFGENKKDKEPALGWLSISSAKPLSTGGRKTSKIDGRRMVRNVSLPRPMQHGWETGDIPGQSFVGQVLEVGSGVDRSFADKNDWVVGLVDVRNCGPLAEFIVIDGRQVHRVPAPYEPHLPDSSRSTLVPEPPSCKPTDVASNKDAPGTNEEPCSPHSALLTCDELALLPLCGIPAYRAVRICMDAFSAKRDDFNVDCCAETPMGEFSHPGRRRRALVLRGHDGAGAVAVQMLVRQGWRVSVHVPFSRVPWDATQTEADGFMLAVEDGLKKWGVDEVIYDDANTYAKCDGEMDDRKAAVVRVIETLRADGDVFDVVLDFVGGREIREAGERLLGLNGTASHGVGQFVTFMGDAPDEAISVSTVADASRARVIHLTNERDVQYTHLGGVFESGDLVVSEILGYVLRFAVEDGVCARVEEVGGELFGRRRVVSLEEVSEALVDGELLSDGGVGVVRVGVS